MNELYINRTEILKENIPDLTRYPFNIKCIKDLQDITLNSNVTFLITRLNISDMNFQERSCIVLGKGNSEREVYFSAKSKMYIKKYLEN